MKFKNRVVAIVSSPLQLISTGEYIHQNKIKNYIIIVLFYNKKELKQIQEVNKIYNLSLEIKLRGYPVIQYYNLFIISKKIKSCQNLLIGNFFSDPHLFFYNLILKSRTTVVDDGMIVNLIPNFIGSNKRILKPGLIKKIFYKAFEYPKKIDLFSIFPVAAHKLISLKKNNLSILNSKIIRKKTSKVLMIIGQPFVEYKMITLEYYISIIQSIKKDFKSYKLIYFPSRKELPKKLNSLSNVCDIDIVQSVNNIEIYFLKNKFIPKKIVGFTSSAMITLNTMFNSNNNLIDISCLKLIFNDNRLSKDVISKMYETLYQKGIYKYEI